ncbi:MAG: hypothetical protein QM755_10905 [Luteolibacter sp.]
MSEHRCFLCQKDLPDNEPVSEIARITTCQRHWMAVWVMGFTLLAAGAVGFGVYLFQHPEERTVKFMIAEGVCVLGSLEFLWSLQKRLRKMRKKKQAEDPGVPPEEP